LILFNVCLINSDTIFQTLLSILFSFLALLFVSIVFKILRSREGLGMGDVLLISFLSGLFELEKIPLLILFASVSGILFYIVMAAVKNERNFEIAFGPHIALSAIWLLFLL
jgi:leader peptidase (prepilin peptidase)/N-methyltransferase